MILQAVMKPTPGNELFLITYIKKTATNTTVCESHSKNTSFLKKTNGSDTLSYNTNNISNTAVTIRKTRKFTVPVIVSHQETDRAIHLTLQ